jgi:MerR family redox-sensitive transcriptional activator SoxR
MANASIGEVAMQTELSAPTLRYYEQIGLLPPVERVAGKRSYDASALERLEVIKLAKSAGLSLDETRELLDGFPPRTPAAARWQHFAQAKLDELDEQQRHIERMRALLGHLMDCCCDDLVQCAQAALDCDEIEVP